SRITAGSVSLMLRSLPDASDRNSLAIDGEGVGAAAVVALGGLLATVAVRVESVIAKRLVSAATIAIAMIKRGVPMGAVSPSTYVRGGHPNRRRQRARRAERRRSRRSSALSRSSSPGSSGMTTTPHSGGRSGTPPLSGGGGPSPPLNPM